MSNDNHDGDDDHEDNEELRGGTNATTATALVELKEVDGDHAEHRDVETKSDEEEVEKYQRPDSSTAQVNGLSTTTYRIAVIAAELWKDDGPDFKDQVTNHRRGVAVRPVRDGIPKHMLDYTIICEPRRSEDSSVRSSDNVVVLEQEPSTVLMVAAVRVG